MTLTKTLSPTGVLVNVNGNDLKQPQVIEDIVDEVAVLESEVDALSALSSSVTAQPGVSVGNSEARVIGMTIPAGTLVDGASFKIEAWGVKTGANTQIPYFAVRVGPTTLTGNFAGYLDGIDPTNGGVFKVDALVTFKVTGAAGKVLAGISQITPATGGSKSDVPAAAVNVDSTADVVVELNAHSQNAANSYSFRVASIYQVQ